jgi:hypothetical protein
MAGRFCRLRLLATTVGIEGEMALKSGNLERATKLSVTLEFGVPDWRDVAGRTERLADEELHSRYFDTPDFLTIVGPQPQQDLRRQWRAAAEALTKKGNRRWMR